MGHRARSRAKDHRTFLPGPLVKKTILRSWNVRAY